MSRMPKINQMMKREIGNIIQRELEDPRVEFVTITNVDVSPDLHNAKVSFSVLGDEKKVQDAINCLNHARGLVRRLVAKRVTLRYIPEIEFFYDKSLDYSSSVEQTIEEIHNEDKADQ